MTTDAKLYGVVHVPPLPGTPFYRSGSLVATVRQVLDQAWTLAEGGMDGVLLQTADRVYGVRDEADPARVAAMTKLAHEVLDQGASGFAVGVQIMRHAVSASLAVAKITGSAFVRADALVGATLSTQGWVEPDPLQIMTYRRAIEAFDVDLVVDVDSMHYHWAGMGESPGTVARRAVGVGADAVVVAHPDRNQILRTLADVRRQAPDVRVLLGGFVDHDNAAVLLAKADGAFVSGCLIDPEDPNRIDLDRVRRLVETVRGTA